MPRLRSPVGKEVPRLKISSISNQHHDPRQASSNLSSMIMKLHESTGFSYSKYWEREARDRLSITNFTSTPSYGLVVWFRWNGMLEDESIKFSFDDDEGTAHLEAYVNGRRFPVHVHSALWEKVVVSLRELYDAALDVAELERHDEEEFERAKELERLELIDDLERRVGV